MENEKDGYIGEFQGHDKMVKDANWFKGTHFQLGGDALKRQGLRLDIDFLGYLV